MSQSEREEIVRKNNRKKIISQNSKLHAQLIRLEASISALQEDSEQKIEEEPYVSPLKGQIEGQTRDIKRLKEQIETRRHQNVKDNVIYIRKEENQLLVLKKEMQALLKEKQLVTSCHQDKLDKLAMNQPLQRHKDGITSQWAEAKKQNRQLNLKIVEMERQIRKLHSIKERAKTASTVHPHQSNLATMEIEIQKKNAEMKAKQLKWKPNLEVLDNEFFTLKNSLTGSQRRIEELAKQQNVWRVRANALRDESELQTDHNRISKLISMPKSQKQKFIDKTHRYYVDSAFSSEKKTNLSSINKTQMVRAESTPNQTPPTKRLLDLININDDMEAKKKVKRSMPPRQSSEQKSASFSQRQMMGSFEKIKPQKKPNNIQQVSVLFNETPQVKEVAELSPKSKLKEKKFSAIRQKHRAKSSAVSNLAEQLQKKADEVKQFNEGIKIEGKIEKNAQKQRVKQRVKIDNKIKAEMSPPQNTLQQTKIKQNTQSIRSSSLANIEKNKSKSSLQKIQKEQKPLQQQPKQIVQIPQQRNSIAKSKPKAAEKPKKERQLAESINISTQPVQVKQPRKVPEQKVPEIKPKTEMIQKPAKVTEPKPQVKTIESPPSPNIVKKTEKPKFDIMIADLGPPRSPKSPKSPKKDVLRVDLLRDIDAEEDTDGIPRIIRRKKPTKPSLVSSSTST